MLLDSRECALEVVGYIECRWVHVGTPLVSSGSFGVDGFSRVRLGGRRVHCRGWFSRGCALLAVVLIQGRWVHVRAP